MRLKLKFDHPVREPVPALLPIGGGRKIKECRSLRELTAYYRGYERAMTEGKVSGMNARCPHCHRRFSVNLIDGLVMVPNSADDPKSSASRVVYCPHAATGCGKQFKLDPKSGWHFETWP